MERKKERKTVRLTGNAGVVGVRAEGIFLGVGGPEDVHAKEVDGDNNHDLRN